MPSFLVRGTQDFMIEAKKRLKEVSTEVVVVGMIIGLVVFGACAYRGFRDSWRDLFCTPTQYELIRAAYLGDALKVKSLLDQGVKPNGLSNYGFTAMDVAEVRGATEVMNVLMEHGARKGLSWWIREFKRLYEEPLE